jgi:hypothetical protein
MKWQLAKLLIAVSLLCFQVQAVSAEVPGLKTHLEKVPLEISHANALSPGILRGSKGEKPALLGKVESNQVAVFSALNEKLGFKSRSEKRSLFPARITGITPNSPIAKCGLTIGDRLVSECTVADKTTLVLEHHGQGMRLTIDKAELQNYLEQMHAKLALSALTGKATVANCPQQLKYEQAIGRLLHGYSATVPQETRIINNSLTGGAQTTAPKPIIQTDTKQIHNIKDMFANHDLAIIVDRSGSMATKDCPGGLSRWQWCSVQASDLAEAAAQASSSINVMFFNNKLDIFENVRPQNLPTLFNNYSPSGGTILGAPLVAQLDRYFAKRSKPLIVVVITDGLPQDYNDLSAIILDASDSLHYVGEVTISFLLIGNQVDAPQLRAWLGEREGGSVDNGGMVDVVSFKNIAQKGIKETLFQELKTIRSATNRYHPSSAVSFAAGRSLAPVTPQPPLYYSSSITNPFPTKWAHPAMQ